MLCLCGPGGLNIAVRVEFMAPQVPSHRREMLHMTLFLLRFCRIHIYQ